MALPPLFIGRESTVGTPSYTYSVRLEQAKITPSRPAGYSVAARVGGSGGPSPDLLAHFEDSRSICCSLFGMRHLEEVSNVLSHLILAVVLVVWASVRFSEYNEVARDRGVDSIGAVCAAHLLSMLSGAVLFLSSALYHYMKPTELHVSNQRGKANQDAEKEGLLPSAKPTHREYYYPLIGMTKTLDVAAFFLTLGANVICDVFILTAIATSKLQKDGEAHFVPTCSFFIGEQGVSIGAYDVFPVQTVADIITALVMAIGLRILYQVEHGHLLSFRIDNKKIFSAHRGLWKQSDGEYGAVMHALFVSVGASWVMLAPLATVLLPTVNGFDYALAWIAMNAALVILLTTTGVYISLAHDLSLLRLYHRLKYGRSNDTPVLNPSRTYMLFCLPHFHWHVVGGIVCIGVLLIHDSVVNTFVYDCGASR